MKENIIKFLRNAFPFVMVIALWRLALPVWNPAGVLALVPIFFCSFVQPVPYFMGMGILFSFLIDYNSNTLFFWTALYCFVYAINGFQNYIDLPRAANRAIVPFMIYFGAGILFLVLAHFGWAVLARGLWTFIWAAILYTPIVMLIQGARDDR